ncbi:hypothetical protein [Methanoregula sp.]|uniref:hypothetical protein n=1 Tax=Methanoregula sp. TaxID=2052170 RepID=UPI002CC7D551|nr:hypothetical protein [Methanoregula sp.]HVP97253.1 hypothetical protein [Methanoregula sp.]
MDTTTTDDITRRLHRFATAVQETRTHASERCTFGRYRAGAPYFEEYPLRSLMDPVREDARITPVHREEYRRALADLASLEKEGGRAYREELLADLSAYTEAYRTLICCHELGLCSPDSILQDPLREEIAVLLVELSGEFPLRDISALVASLDETLCILRRSPVTGSCGADPAVGAAQDVSLWQPRCSSSPSRERTRPL